jgi:hypothetical protein
VRAEEESYPLIRLAAKRILDAGGRCSTELVARAAGVPLTETSPVYRALCSDESTPVNHNNRPGR